MEELIESKIREMYSLIMDKPKQVLAIFNDFFGEDKVDMQGFMSLDKFRLWINKTPIYHYISRDMLGISLDEFNTFKDTPLTNLTGGILNNILNILCCSRGLLSNIINSNDFVSGFILIHFPHVRVTNEFNRFVDINHLYAKVHIFYNGSMDGYFALNRSEYTYLHIKSNYMHSHVSTIPTHDFTEFQTPCTGSGPINRTMACLNREFDSDIWKLFCLELSKFVEVESVSGVPFHRLEKLGTLDMILGENSFKVINILEYYAWDIVTLLKEFFIYFIKQGKLKFNFANGSYSIGMSFTEYIILISNEFINWYNKRYNNKEVKYTFKHLKDACILREVVIANNKIYQVNPYRSINSYADYNGSKMCTFKGRDICIDIIDLKEVEETNQSIILNPNVALYMLSKILFVINYKYGRTEQRDQEGNRISEKVRYL